jgi:two-component system NtrC family sensor kinase
MLYCIIIYCLSLVIYGFLINKYWERKIKGKTRLVKETEAQLIQMEKMASLGTLAAGIAHEINNPLSFLVSNLESLRDYVGRLIEGISLETPNNKVLAEDLKSMTQESLEGALRIKKIVCDLRTFSRRSETNKILVDVNQVLESTLSIIWNEIKYKAILIKDYQAKSELLAEPTQLSQVFLNILINAEQAISGKGTISLSTYEDAENVYIKISDTGCGIPAETLPKIFEPFFSTKKGTGLGLSVSYNIIKRDGGDIKAESKVGSGTTFTIRLPKNVK